MSERVRVRKTEREREREREVGSRGFVGYNGFCQLRDSVGASQKELNDLLLAVSLAAIKGSFQIWTCRNHVNGE